MFELPFAHKNIDFLAQLRIIVKVRPLISISLKNVLTFVMLNVQVGVQVNKL